MCLSPSWPADSCGPTPGGFQREDSSVFRQSGGSTPGQGGMTRPFILGPCLYSGFLSQLLWLWVMPLPFAESLYARGLLPLCPLSPYHVLC